jgi:hypothetical protein
MLRHGTAWLLWLAVLGSTTPGAVASPAPSAEYQLKAVFLFNFAQFVEWPAPAFREPAAPLVIGVLGDDPFGAYLDDLVRGEKIGNRPLRVRRYKPGEDFTECHIIFVCRSEIKELDKILGRLKGRSLLTVSDADTFTRQGGMVRFAMENGKVRLRINIEAAKASDLTISSKILRPGTIITAGKD